MVSFPAWHFADKYYFSKRFYNYLFPSSFGIDYVVFYNLFSYVFRFSFASPSFSPSCCTLLNHNLKILLSGPPLFVFSLLSTGRVARLPRFGSFHLHYAFRSEAVVISQTFIARSCRLVLLPHLLCRHRQSPQSGESPSP